MSSIKAGNDAGLNRFMLGKRKQTIVGGKENGEMGLSI